MLYWWELNDESFADGVNPSGLLCIGQHVIKLVVRDPVDNISTDEVSITVTGEPTFLYRLAKPDSATLKSIMAIVAHSREPR